MNVVVEARAHLLRNQVIVQTYAICAHLESTPRYYEVYVAPSYDARDQWIRFVTRDETLYDFALAIEGFDAHVDVEWRAEKRRPNGKTVSLLTGLRRVAA